MNSKKFGYSFKESGIRHAENFKTCIALKRGVCIQRTSKTVMPKNVF